MASPLIAGNDLRDMTPETIAVLTNQGAKDPAKIAESLLKIVLPPLPGASSSGSPSASP